MVFEDDDLLGCVCGHLNYEDLYMISCVNKLCHWVAHETYKKKTLAKNSHRRRIMIRPKMIFLYTIEYADFFLQQHRYTYPNAVIMHLVSQAVFLYGRIEVVDWFFFQRHQEINKRLPGRTALEEGEAAAAPPPLACLKHLKQHILNLKNHPPFGVQLVTWRKKIEFVKKMLKYHRDRLKQTTEYLRWWYNSNIDGFSDPYSFNNSFAALPELVFLEGRQRFEQTDTYMHLKHDMDCLDTWNIELSEMVM